MRNIQTVNKLVARDLNKDEKLVESINSFFWKEVRRSLSSFEHTSVAIKNVGIITVSERRLIVHLLYIIKKIRATKINDKIKETTRTFLLNIYYEKLRKGLIQRNILAKQYYESDKKRSERNKRILELDANNSGELARDMAGHIESSEVGIEYAAGGRTDGDSEKESNL